MYKKILRKIDLLKGSADVCVYYITETANWSIRQDGLNIVGHLKETKGIVCTAGKHIPRSAIRHYGSFNIPFGDKYFKTNGITIVTCFHIVDGDPRAEKIKELDKYVTIWHTSCLNTKQKLIHFGVAENKIIVIPLGIDLDIYKPLNNVKEREKLRAELGIMPGQLVVGSFQKDGNGWEEGDTPKLIKGPDIFCDMVEKLSQTYDVFVLLSGPARGYVKKRLETAGVPYAHEYFKDAVEVAKLYPLIDVYTVTSREEGGPKAILESMASGVPIISTKVGMAPDIIDNGENGILVECEDLDGLVDAVRTVWSSDTIRNRLVEQGRITAKEYDMNKIAERYEKELYQYVLQGKYD